jgi:hypothetical protein
LTKEISLTLDPFPLYFTVSIHCVLQKEIERALEDACAILPLDVRHKCRQFVKQYTVVVVQLLLQEMDPTQVCLFIDLCPKNTTNGKQSHSGQHLMDPPFARNCIFRSIQAISLQL